MKSRHLVFTLIVCTFLCNNSYVGGQTITVDRIEPIGRYISKVTSLSVLRIQTKSAVASGALMASSSFPDRNLIVTNKHVIDGQSEITVCAHLADSSKSVVDTILFKVPLYGNNTDSLFVVGPSNIDLAVILCPRVPLRRGKPRDLQPINENLGVPLDSLYPGMSVQFIGHPMGLSVNTSDPLIRVGVVSGIDSAKQICYIDGQVFGGSSGSPVFVNSFTSVGASFISRQGGSPLIGFISDQVAFEKVLYNPQTKRNEMIQYENSGIGIVQPVELVRNLIQQLKKKFGPQ